MSNVRFWQRADIDKQVALMDELSRQGLAHPN